MRKGLIAVMTAATVLVGGMSVAHAGEGVKVLVCKYVGTPGENETLKDGKNPIEVDSSTTGGATEPGSIFADAQGRSLVIGADDVCPPTPDARAKFRLVVRMAGLGSPYRTTLKWFPGSPVSASLLNLVCSAKISAGFEVHIGSQVVTTPTFTSRAGPILRVYEGGALALKLRASDSC